MSDKFNYGSTFQIKTITSLLTDRAFCQQVSDILFPEFFESEQNAWIVNQILKYFSEFKSVPTLEVFTVKLADVDNAVTKTAIKAALTEVYRYAGAEDLAFIKERVLDFCKNQCIKNAILKSVDLLGNGEYDQIKTQIDAAMKSGADRNIGYEFMSGIADRYTTNARNTIPTCWPLINELAGGGFGAGEMVVFVAPPGIGKSTTMMNIGAYAVQKGLRVVHYTMELSEQYTAQRYDAIITGIATQNLQLHVDEVESTLKKKVTGDLIIKYYPTKSASVNTLRAHLDQLILVGKKPDMIIVDYADLLKSTGRTKEKTHEDLEIIYEELRGIAGEYGIPLYTASQSNRSSADSEVVTGDQIASSFAKVMVGDFIISLSRRATDKISGTGRFFVIKNRFGPDGMTLPSKINMSNGQMDIYEETSVKGQNLKNDMKTAQVDDRAQMLARFKEIKASSPQIKSFD